MDINISLQYLNFSTTHYLFRDRQQITFEFFSRLCLLRGGGGQDKSAKNG